MTHVSRIKLDKLTEKKLIETFDLVLAKIAKEENMEKFLVALLTPTERLMLAKRLAIIILLKEELPESRIASTLHVTRITVSRMLYYLESRGQGFNIAIKVLQNEKLLQDIKTILFKLAGYSIRAAGGTVKPSIF